MKKIRILLGLAFGLLFYIGNSNAQGRQDIHNDNNESSQINMSGEQNNQNKYDYYEFDNIEMTVVNKIPRGIFAGEEIRNEFFTGGWYDVGLSRNGKEPIEYIWRANQERHNNVIINSEIGDKGTIHLVGWSRLNKIKLPQPNASAPLHTQALLNEEINIMRKNTSFVLAQVPDGYQGYIKISDITNDTSSLYAPGDKVIVKAKAAAIYDLSGNEIYKAPMSTIFFGNLHDEKYLITLPQNIQGYINKENVMVIPGNEKIPVGNRETFARIARLFLGTKYLWGGCSGDGIDCSGLTYIAAKMNGIKIPRDSHPQSEEGIFVDLRNTVVGDQLFFGSDSRKTRVSHTGIYLGNGNFIHSSPTNGVAISNIITSNIYMSMFMFAKRLPFGF